MKLDQIHKSLRTRYAAVAEQPRGQFNYPIGRDSAERLQYGADHLASIPASVVDRFVGVGNPFSLGDPKTGWHVVDIGCGAGLDAQVAARLVGTTGHVIAVDLCVEMLAFAKLGIDEAAISNVTLLEGLAESLPVDDGWADLILSNGVLNLATCKASAFAEIARVLRPGGVFQAVDLILTKPLPHDLRQDEFAWSN